MKRVLVISKIFALLSTLSHAEGALPPYARDKLQIDAAWGLTKGSSNVTVATISTGASVEFFNEKNLAKNEGEIPGNGKDDDNNGYIDDDLGIDTYSRTAPKDLHGIGTHVASLIASEHYGIAPEVKILPIVVTSEYGTSTTEAILEAIHYAKNRGATIIYVGVGGSKNALLCDALKETGLPVIATAGNSAYNLDDANLEFFPATCDGDNILTVAGSDSNDALTYYSNYGRSYIDLAAPAHEIPGLGKNGKEVSYSGTSVAAGFAAAVAALVASLHPEYSTEQIISALKQGVDTTEELELKLSSGGRLNAYKALIAEVE